MPPVILRRTQLGLLTVGVIVTLLVLVMVAGCYRDDASIESHKATAVAEVVVAGATKSTVRFTTPDGTVQSPRLGVFYPSELTAGQRITVEYDSRKPDLVRVAGRDASLAWIPALSIAGYTWVIVATVMVLLAQWSRRRRSQHTETASTPADALA
ncbi:DUF3592 domain-containing protein [Williamsia sp. CHRR-6]|uniref:DUF3592 domain-containing protein n=1 Tax=Williamsia sp. CHRR-6 TaxID=2835871 RepID=UPI001BDB5835|nr:DUF3592 domain-containing protein [Williamsia sp. CHRR-6]MBT0565908.1 hypothetical protein [Williamsia sp. CHRR-6]